MCAFELLDDPRYRSRAAGVALGLHCAVLALGPVVVLRQPWSWVVTLFFCAVFAAAWWLAGHGRSARTLRYLPLLAAVISVSLVCWISGSASGSRGGSGASEPFVGKAVPITGAAPGERPMPVACRRFSFGGCS